MTKSPSVEDIDTFMAEARKVSVTVVGAGKSIALATFIY